MKRNVWHKLQMEKSFSTQETATTGQARTEKRKRYRETNPQHSTTTICGNPRCCPLSCYEMKRKKIRNLHLGIEFLGISFNAYPNTKHMDVEQEQELNFATHNHPRLLGYSRIYGKSNGRILAAESGQVHQALINRKVRLPCQKLSSPKS